MSKGGSFGGVAVLLSALNVPVSSEISLTSSINKSGVKVQSVESSEESHEINAIKEINRIKDFLLNMTGSFCAI
jgi:hypothetical protein